jgi:hypothetical protein
MVLDRLDALEAKMDRRFKDVQATINEEANRVREIGNEVRDMQTKGRFVFTALGFFFSGLGAMIAFLWDKITIGFVP